MPDMPNTADDVRFIRKFPDKCCAEVSRGGEAQPCDKTAVAVADGSAEYGGGAWWPVCAFHARGRSMVSLAELVRALSRRGTWDDVERTDAGWILRPPFPRASRTC